MPLFVFDEGRRVNAPPSVLLGDAVHRVKHFVEDHAGHEVRGHEGLVERGVDADEIFLGDVRAELHGLSAPAARPAGPRDPDRKSSVKEPRIEVLQQLVEIVNRSLRIGFWGRCAGLTEEVPVIGDERLNIALRQGVVFGRVEKARDRVEHCVRRRQEHDVDVRVQDALADAAGDEVPAILRDLEDQATPETAAESALQAADVGDAGVGGRRGRRRLEAEGLPDRVPLRSRGRGGWCDERGSGSRVKDGRGFFRGTRRPTRGMRSPRRRCRRSCGEREFELPSHGLGFELHRALGARRAARGPPLGESIDGTHARRFGGGK